MWEEPKMWEEPGKKNPTPHAPPPEKVGAAASGQA